MASIKKRPRAYAPMAGPCPSRDSWSWVPATKAEIQESKFPFHCSSHRFKDTLIIIFPLACQAKSHQNRRSLGKIVTSERDVLNTCSPKLNRKAHSPLPKYLSSCTPRLRNFIGVMHKLSRFLNYYFITNIVFRYDILAFSSEIPFKYQ